MNRQNRSDRGFSLLGQAIAAERSVADGEALESASEAATDDGVDSFNSHRNGVVGVVDGEEGRETGRVPVAVGRNGTAEGVIVVGDDLHEGWAETLSAITEMGTGGVTVVDAVDAYLQRKAVGDPDGPVLEPMRQTSMLQ